MTATIDARTLNWRFVIPNEPEGLLLLPVSQERLPFAVVPEPGPEGLAAALRRGPFPGIAAPDLGSWSGRRPGAASRLLARLCAEVDSPGWLYAGFANAWYPGAPARPGSLGALTAARIMRRSGLSELEVYLALPSQRRTAFLVPASRPAEFNHFLRYMFLTYIPAGSSWAMARRRVIAAFRRGALVIPHPIRSQLAPAFGILARRSQ